MGGATVASKQGLMTGKFNTFLLLCPFSGVGGMVVKRKGGLFGMKRKFGQFRSAQVLYTGTVYTNAKNIQFQKWFLKNLSGG